jgi:hypothetical protein
VQVSAGAEIATDIAGQEPTGDESFWPRQKLIVTIDRGHCHGSNRLKPSGQYNNTFAVTAIGLVAHVIVVR